MARVADQRKIALSARRKLSAADRRRAARLACRRLARLPVIRRARRIGIYRPLASEIDPRGLIDLLGPRPPRFYFPRVCGDTLRFVAARRDQRWRRSTLGVHEPGGWSHATNTLDVLIMPLVGFDRAANRIGLGGGFYDRTLAPVSHLAYRGPTRIGLAFECQRLNAIEPRPWDISLTAIATERRVYQRRWAHSR
ncbi:5-formyltetrahydrofolate cyclo-ligase [Salinisphaera sp.]|uniref:5-formyltetrahydrofolate cyclo-ligase n=1 Tax=Salinisphaera sp. TaxID=1914330 RepID=UPI002D798CA0|nr:5-formyltetrahydrofolate cyclo-ligase [Salinisphaera sp.]HET7315110.1 5-formyltetrahydrofolate cyclo-ligase [Salinisphaera sp.]